MPGVDLGVGQEGVDLGGPEYPVGDAAVESATER